MTLKRSGPVSAPKVGDRVHLEADGVVDTVGQGRVWVRTDDGLIREVSPHLLTVIVPPIKVGDVVGLDNIGQLPEWSVIAFTDGPSWTRSDDGLWVGWLEQGLTDRGLLTAARKVPTVLRIGGGS